MNQYESARRFYEQRNQAILSTKKNEWAMDAYEWSEFIELTPIEYSLWCEIRCADLVMYPQYPVGRYFVDFASPRAKVAIECDGHAYHLDKAKDAARQKDIEALGWTVYRITGRDCHTSGRESVDEFGVTRYEAGASEAFIKRIGDNHGLKRSSCGTHAGAWIGMNGARV